MIASILSKFQPVMTYLGRMGIEIGFSHIEMNLLKFTTKCSEPLTMSKTWNVTYCCYLE